MARRSHGTVLNVQATSDTRSIDEIEKGRVGEVRQQFQIHEDTALAHRLQSQEIENHVSHNKEQRKSVRDNIKTAKQTYLEEVKNAGVLPENSVAELEQKQWLAEELHRRVEEQENVSRSQVERQQRRDEEIALQAHHEEEKRRRYLEHKRIEKLMLGEEEHRRLQKIMKELQEAEITDHGESNENNRHGNYESADDDLLVQLPQSNEMITLADGTVIDAKHNEIQTEEQKKQHMQRRDEELARILQEQEDHQVAKRKTMQQDYRKAIELQDREIAKHLQRQEKAKAERRREKMRRGESLPERDELHSGQRRHLPTYHEAIGVEDLEREGSRHRSHAGETREPERTNGNSAKRVSRRSYQDRQEDVWLPRDNDHETGVTRIRDSGEPAGTRVRDSEEPGAYYDNVAETLDPTYRRISRRATVPGSDEQHDRQTGGKTAPIVPPLKRKGGKEKGKRDKDKDCKQQ